MAVTGISHKDAVERQHKMEAWSGVISWALYGLLAVLVVSVVLVLLEGRRNDNRVAELRAGWDQYHKAFKEKETVAGQKGLSNADRIPILEGLWETTKGTPVQPFVALELAQCLCREAVNALRDPDTGQRTQMEEAIRNQRAALEKALKVFDIVRKNWPDNPAYGPLAFDGAAFCQEQVKDYTAAIGILEDAVKKHPKHFLVEKMRYDLARNYWLRALKSEADGKDGAEDRSRALENVTRVVSEVADKDVSQMSWRHDARYLRSLLQKPGDALKIFPDGKLPAKPEPKKDTGAAQPKPDLTPNAAKLDAAKVDAPKAEEAKKPEPEKKIEADKKPEAGK